MNQAIDTYSQLDLILTGIVCFVMGIGCTIGILCFLFTRLFKSSKTKGFF